MIERTELEQHVIQHFAETHDPEFDLDDNVHVLKEHYDGYKKNEENCYASTPAELDLIADFVRIVGEDIEGSYNYDAEDCRRVIEAMETFGL